MMENLDKFIDIAPGERLYLNRTGPATCALLASRALEQGQTVVLLAFDRVAYHELLALTRLFIPVLSSSDYKVDEPIWKRPLLGFPSMRLFGNRDEWANRMASLYSLSLLKPSCIVTTPQNLLLRYMPRNFFDKRFLELSAGSEFSPELIIDQAIEWGYERVPMVSRPGEL